MGDNILNLPSVPDEVLVFLLTKYQAWLIEEHIVELPFADDATDETPGDYTRRFIKEHVR